MSYHCELCGGEVDLSRTPLESGLVRLATLGPERFELAFDDPAVHAAAAPALGACPHVADPSWDAAELRPLADAGWRALLAAEDDELDLLAVVWRPRALALAGRADELSRDDVVRGRLEQRVAEVVGAHAGRARRGRGRRGRAPARPGDRARHGARGPARGRVASLMDGPARADRRR